MPKENPWLTVFLILYILSLGFTDVLELPFIGSKVQIPELSFIPLFFSWLWTISKSEVIEKFKLLKLDIAFLLLLLAYILSAVFAEGRKAWFDVIGLCYLLIVYAIVRSSFIYLNNAWHIIKRSLIASAAIAAISGILGWSLTQYSFDNILAMPKEIHYPYLGYIGRATGFMTSPNMLMNFTGIGLLLFLPEFLAKKRSARNYVLLFLLSLGALLTFSKSILLLIIGILLILSNKNFSMIGKRVFYAASIILFVLLMLGTHILIRKDNSIDWTQRREKAYTAAAPIYQYGEYSFYATNYTVNKEAACRAGSRHFLVGIGPGMFNEYVGELKEQGLYPKHFINFDPHSTYFGALAETGIIGLAALLYLSIVIILIFIRIDPKSKSHTAMLALATCFLFMGLEAINMDVLNFRHLWVLFGITSQITSEYPNHWQKQANLTR